MAKRKKRIKIPASSPAKAVLVLLLVAVLAVTAWFAYLAREIENRFASRKWSVPAVVFSDSVICYPGQNLSLERVRRMLLVRRYQQVSGRTPRAGEFKVSGRRLDVYLRTFTYPGKNLESRPVRLTFTANRIARIESRGKTLGYLELEPIVMAHLFGREKESRHLISIKQVPQDLVNAVVSIEDHRFFEHRGLDWLGILRALWIDLRAGRVVQGGSTITQQLIKNYFLDSRRTLKRKVQEACMALVLEARYSKEEILEMYLNEIYLGQRGGVAIHGVGEAALYYFGKNVRDLSLSEAATLAGMIRAPNAYSPRRRPEACKKRRNLVLRRMVALHKISRQQYARARLEPVRTIRNRLPLKVAPYFVDSVRHQLNKLYSPEALASEGLNIYTSLHPEIEFAAERAVKEGLGRLEKKFPRLKGRAGTSPLQALIVVVQPKTGQVLALVGGRDYDQSSFNRALFAKRQPGSAFKPFVYLAALDRFQPLDRIDDEPMSYTVKGRKWAPRNYDRVYHGPVTLETALAKSYNAATVNLAMKVGLDKVIKTARRLGIESPIKPYPSLALGAFEVTPMELAGAYTVLDNDGLKPYLLSLKKVISPRGEVRQKHFVRLRRATTSAKAFLITHLLQAVMRFGTGSSARRLGITFPCAGKTGTTSNYRDSWFVGYTSDLLALVWVGYDDNRPTYLSGSRGALRLWVRFMKAIRPWIHPQPFRVPPGIVERYVCRQSNQLATAFCPERRIEYFLQGHLPALYCPLHSQ